jgi:hypothetical protein
MEHPMPHRFKLGQTVQLIDGRRHGTTSATGFKVVRQLPESDGECSYRIKGAHETFERVANESQLIKV